MHTALLQRDILRYGTICRCQRSVAAAAACRCLPRWRADIIRFDMMLMRRYGALVTARLMPPTVIYFAILLVDIG